MRKKLFAILMSAMMMVTFMPAMAFATDTIVWGDKGASVTVNGKTYDHMTRTWDNETGKITSNIDTTYYGAGTYPTIPSKVFYDLDSAVIEPVQSVMTYSAFVGLFGDPAAAPATTALSLKLNVPSYVENASAKTAKAAATLEDHAVVCDTPMYDTNNKYADQTFTIKAQVGTTMGSAIATYGAIADKTFTVQAQGADATPANALLLLDGKTALTNAGAGTTVNPYTATGSVEYDGAEHVVALQSIPGITATYQVWNAAKGVYEAADAIKVTNKGAVNAVATITKGTTTITRSVTFTVNAANKPAFAFDAYATGKTAFDVADNYKVADYLVINPSTVGSEAKDKTDAAAAKANADLLKEYFNDFYKFNVTESKYDSTASATIEKKDLSALTVAEKDALVAKYGVMLANFNIVATRNDITTDAKMISAAGTANFVIAPAKANSVEIYNMTKTYKAKALKKAKKSFAINAEATSGEITFKKVAGSNKLSVKDGKVVVKKGTKKGTYKVKVKATAAAGNGYAAASVVSVLKVKVK